MSTKLKILKSADDKIRTFTELCPQEISGLGKVELIDEVLTVTDVEIFDQTVSGAHSTIRPEDLAKFQDNIVKNGGSMKQWCFWWHSHANMGVFFSKTDTDTIESSTEFPWLVSLVVNKKGESKARLDVYTPLHLFTELDIEIEVEKEDDGITKLRAALEKALETKTIKTKEVCQREIDKKVKTYQTAIVPYTRQAFTSSHQSRWTDAYEYEPTAKELEREYWGHKVFLIAQVEHLRKMGHKKHEAYLKRVAELEDHKTWGTSLGFEVTRFQE